MASKRKQRRDAIKAGIGCHYCNKTGRASLFTKDHIVPRAHGGPNAKWNYVLACSPCNQAKAATMPTCQCPRCRNAVERFWEIYANNQDA